MMRASHFRQRGEGVSPGTVSAVFTLLFLISMHPQAVNAQYPACGAATNEAGSAVERPLAPERTKSQSEKSPLHQLKNPRTVQIQANRQEKIRDTYKLLGEVIITYNEMKITADQATMDGLTNEVTARGHVVFTDPQAHLESDEAHYNLNSGAGDFSNARGYFRPRVRPRPHTLTTSTPFHLQATEVRRVNEDLYLAQGARLTSCEDEKRGWSMSTSNARVLVGDRVTTHGDVFHFFRMPLFYLPAAVNSIAAEPRQTGFLLPLIGTSGLKGFMIGDGVFWAINPSVDVMVGLADYSKRGVATTGRFRARPSATSQLNIDYFGVNDKATPKGIRAAGESLRAVGGADHLGYGFRGVVDVDYVNTLAFRLTFSDNFTQAVTAEDHQTGFLTKNFSAYSLNFYVTRYQNFLSTAQTPGNSVVIQQTPTVSFSSIDRQIGESPLLFSFEGSAGAVERTQPGSAALTQLSLATNDRLDIHPQLTLRPESFWGFHLTPTVGLRATHYGTSLRSTPLTRGLAEVGVDLRPPSLERVFSRPYHGHLLKHVIEPDIRYRLVRASDREDIDEVVRYDQIDIFSETNEVEYSLNNVLFARKQVADDQQEKPPARELVSLRLSQKYFFDPTFGGVLQPGNVVWEPALSLTGFAFAQGRRLSPLVSVLKIAPFSNYDTELRADFNPSGGGVLNAGITSHVRRGPIGLALTEFLIDRTATLLVSLPPSTSLSQLRSFNLLQSVITYGDINRKGFSGAFGVDYNFVQGIAHQIVSQTSYNFGCFAIDLEYRRFALGTLRNENALRVALSLANVGTFGNLRTRERLY